MHPTRAVRWQVVHSTVAERLLAGGVLPGGRLLLRPTGARRAGAGVATTIVVAIACHHGARCSPYAASERGDLCFRGR